MPHCTILMDTLRQRGYRLTPQREMVVETLAHSGRHMTAEEVLDVVRQRTRAVNIATVYRTLDLLVEEGLASRADLGGGRLVYATLEHGPHIHLVCQRCGRVVEADLDAFHLLLDEAEDAFGFVCRPQHIALPGLCRDCQKARQNGTE